MGDGSIGAAASAVRATNRNSEEAAGQVGAIIDNLERQRAALMQAGSETNQCDVSETVGAISSLIDYFDTGRRMIMRTITMVEDIANRL